MISKHGSAVAPTWPTVRLARLTLGLQDGTHGTHERVDSGIPLLSAKNVTERGLEVGEAESQIAETEAASIIARGFPRTGDVLLTIVGTIGRTAVYELSDPLPFQRSVCFVRPIHNVHSGYLCFALQSVAVQDQMRLRAKSSAQAGLYLGDVASLGIPRPTFEQQRRIAEFLARETAQIDELIAKQEQLISTLAERRKTSIRVFATTGLDSEVELTDGGEPWRDDFPRRWNPTPVNTIMRAVKQLVGDSWALTQLLSLTKRGVIVRDIESGEGKYPESFETYQHIQPGDLVFCLFDVDETPRTVGLARQSGMLTGAYTRYVVDRRRAMPEWLEYYFTALDDEKRLRPVYTGLRKVITKDRFGSLRIPVPPLSEQAAIVEVLEDLTAKTDELTAKAVRAVELLRERRQALISAAVTGQIDVGGAS
ncbi:MAG: restriction endonuclease subunit S [Lacipirellulaceae bacterium]